MTNNSHAETHPPYVKIWVGLLFALIISLLIGEVWSNEVAVVFIFAVALAKAGVVLAYFMHLRFAPLWLKLVGVGAVAVVAVLYIGLVPDIQMSYSAVQAPAASNAPRSETHDQTPQAVASTASHRGAKVFSTYCVACHQADGRGMGGKLAADFIGDKSRLAKRDVQLIASIRDGITGEIGAMPPWGSLLSETQQTDVLKYIREEFGNAE